MSFSRSARSDSSAMRSSRNSRNGSSTAGGGLFGGYSARSSLGASAGSGGYGRSLSSLGRTPSHDDFSSLSLSGGGGSAPVLTHPGEIDVSKLRGWAGKVQSQPQTRLAQTILQRANMEAVLASSKVQHDDVCIFNTLCGLEGTPVPNQKQSGRCWLFALTDVCRVFTARYYRLGDFQISQSYLFFYDHLAKANWFLEQMIELADRPLDDRTIVFLMTSSEAQDGGQYQMAVNLVQKYGLVPQSVYPESFNSSNSAALDKLLTSKLREMALDLRRTIAMGGGPSEVQSQKDEFLEEIYTVLAITCGTPPRPDEKFEWCFEDKHGKVGTIVKTPLEWARDCLGGYDPADCISLVNDPRNAYHKTLVPDRLGNVVGGTQVKYLNLDIDQMKKFVIKALQANCPVWFGCDVDASSSTNLGVMDMELYHYDDAFGTSLSMTKEERMRTGDSCLTHAMTFCGVHLDSDGNPVRWKVENSWGPAACIKGFLVMSDEWFSEFVYQVVIPRSQLPSAICDEFDSIRPIVLPAWDPMGACAGSPGTAEISSAVSGAESHLATLTAAVKEHLKKDEKKVVDSAHAIAARAKKEVEQVRDEVHDKMGNGTPEGAADPTGGGSGPVGTVSKATGAVSTGRMGGGMSGMMMRDADLVGNARASSSV